MAGCVDFYLKKNNNLNLKSAGDLTEYGQIPLQYMCECGDT